MVLTLGQGLKEAFAPIKIARRASSPILANIGALSNKPAAVDNEPAIPYAQSKTKTKHHEKQK